MKRSITEQEKNQAVELYLQGNTILHISRILHRSTPVIRKFITDAGLEVGHITNLVGRRFNRLEVIKLSHISQSGQAMWECKCDCGKITISRATYLLSNRKISCGCFKIEQARKAKFNDLTGKKFGNLTITKHLGCPENPYGQTQSLWECQCICGNIIEVFHSYLCKKNFKRSCGCSDFYSRAENHYNWNPNLTDDQRINRRHMPEYSEWRLNVYKRDNYRCVLSGKTGSLNAHHLNCWNLYPKERLDISNGVTLNKKLHTLFHQLYGKKNNASHFQEFKTRYENGEFS